MRPKNVLDLQTPGGRTTVVTGASPEKCVAFALSYPAHLAQMADTAEDGNITPRFWRRGGGYDRSGFPHWIYGKKN